MTEPKNLILHDIGQPSPPTRADALKNRALILTTAARLFAERDIHRVTMSDIAEAAEIGKGTLYRHFEDKAQLCQALLDEDQRSLQDRALDYFRSQGNPLDNLGWFLVEVALFVDRNASLLCVSSDHTKTLSHPAHWWWRQTIRGLLGQINPPGDLEYLTDLLYVMLDINTIYFQRTSQGYSIQRIADGLLDTLHRITK
ncbi:MAG: TetR/AcrR family transcriptional regulator [Anaerolineae bacterium]|nr:TetR/AcrR family transcriptional regulator [Anaerolineae bacterium]